MRTKFLPLLYIMFALICLNACAEEGIELVKDGKEKAIIVIAENPTFAAVEGARIFADHIFQVSGARLKVFSENALGEIAIKDNQISTSISPADNYILIGESKLTKQITNIDDLGPGGVLIQTIDNALLLLGPGKETPMDQDGTRYAVTTFLEEYLDIRYLWPGELGKVVPKNKNVVIPTGIEKRYTPPIKQRYIRCSFYTSSARIDDGLNFLGLTKEEFLKGRREGASTNSFDGDWINWQRLGGSLDIEGRHAFGTLWEQYGEEQPEWFALQPDGTRDQSREPGRARLCKSNKGLIDQIAKDKIEELNNNPTIGGISLSPNDGGSYLTYCMCDNCKALDHPDGKKISLAKGTIEYVSLTDRIIHFSNGIAEQVAKVHPDKFLSVDAYSHYTAPPLRERLHPSLIVRFVGISYESEEARQQGLEEWDGWRKMTSQIYWRPNLLHYATRTGTLNSYAHKLAEDFSYLTQTGMFATDFDSIGHHWATDGLNYYVLSKLMWDPYLDVDEVIDDYCGSGFGSGAPYIREYFSKVEELTNAYMEGNIQGYNVTAPYTEENVSLLRGLLEKAYREVEKNGENPDYEKQLERIVFLQKGLDFNEIQGELYRMHQQRVAGQAFDRFEACWLLDQRHELMLDIFENYPYALNIAYITWADKGLMKYLGWYGPTTR